jgi:hypothetical protein
MQRMRGRSEPGNKDIFFFMVISPYFGGMFSGSYLRFPAPLKAKEPGQKPRSRGNFEDEIGRGLLLRGKAPNPGCENE